MPSVEQMVNEIQTILGQVEANTGVTAQQVDKVREDADALKTTTASVLATTQAGFVNLSEGLATVIDRQEETNGLLDINNAENQTIICWLRILADLSCQQLRLLAEQVQLQESIDRSTRRSLKIAELVNAREAVEVQREQELIERIEKCCPSEHPEPKPCFEPCEERRPDPHQRKISSFKPLRPAKG
jgi:hypothetical protein